MAVGHARALGARSTRLAWLPWDLLKRGRHARTCRQPPEDEEGLMLPQLSFELIWGRRLHLSNISR